jgi:acetolactate synthase I/II/III large subunit
LTDAENPQDHDASIDTTEALASTAEEAQESAVTEGAELLEPPEPPEPAGSAQDTGETDAAPADTPEPPEPAEPPEPPEPPEPAEPPESAQDTGETDAAPADTPEPAAPPELLEPPEPAGSAQDTGETDAAPADTPEPAGVPAPTPAAQPEPPPTVRRTVSAEIARLLHASGARYCFTVPAEPILPLLDDLADVGVRVVTTRHEGGAAFMAEAMAQSTGRPQIVAVSRAVGSANAAIGIHTAQQDSAPLVALAGQVASPFIGREAFQEADLVAGVGSLASWSAQIDAPDQAAAVLAKALKHLHTGRPGPIVLSIPVDVQSAEVELPDGQSTKASGARGPAADRPAVSRAMKLLAASERGVIVAGGGVLQSRATKRLVALSEALAVPVIAAWRRPDVFPNDHVNYLGMAGTAAASTVAQRLADADVIMFIGTRLSEITTDGYAIPGPLTRWIHVDVQPRVAAAGLPAPTLSITADASRFLDSAWSDLRAAALDNEMRSRREARNAADREAYRAASAVGQGSWDGPGLHPGRLFAILRGALPDNATITTDAGNLAAFVARGYRFRRAGTFLGATSGAMGFGLPAAIAASLLDPDRIAVAICGDGGFATTMIELETAVREGAHPIAIVLDNQRYGSIAVQQSREGRPTRSTELGAIDFAGVARAHGALGFSVTDEHGLRSALREAITSRQPSVIHVVVDRAWRSVDDNPVTASA